MFSLLGTVMSNYAAAQQAKAQIQAARLAHGLPPEPESPSTLPYAAKLIAKALATDALTYAIIIAIGLVYAALT